MHESGRKVGVRSDTGRWGHPVMLGEPLTELDFLARAAWRENYVVRTGASHSLR